MKSRKGQVVILDFDWVIFNTELFKWYLSKIFKANGLDFEKLYRKVKKELGIFSFSRCLEMIKDPYKIGLIEGSIEKLLENGRQFLFSDVLPFLRELRKKHARVMILTRVARVEDRKFQQLKVNSLGPIFNNLTSEASLVITAYDKADCMLPLLYSYGRGKDIFFVDDSQEEIEKMEKAHGDRVICIKISRGKPMVRTEVPNLKWASQTIRDLEGLNTVSQEVLINSFSK